MSHIDIFETYESLLNSGVPEPQAKAQVRALDNAMDKVSTKDDLKIAISGLEKDLKSYNTKLLIGTVFVTYLIPIAVALTLKVLRLV